MIFHQIRRANQGGQTINNPVLQLRRRPLCSPPARPACSAHSDLLPVALSEDEAVERPLPRMRAGWRPGHTRGKQILSGRLRGPPYLRGTCQALSATGSTLGISRLRRPSPSPHFARRGAEKSRATRFVGDVVVELGGRHDEFVAREIHNRNQNLVAGVRRVQRCPGSTPAGTSSASSGSTLHTMFNKDNPRCSNDSAHDAQHSSHDV